MCLFAIHIYLCSHHLPNFFYQVIFFQVLSSVNILDASPLLDMYFVNIFSQSLTCLLTVSFKECF